MGIFNFLTGNKKELKQALEIIDAYQERERHLLHLIANMDARQAIGAEWKDVYETAIQDMTPDQQMFVRDANWLQRKILKETGYMLKD